MEREEGIVSDSNRLTSSIHKGIMLATDQRAERSESKHMKKGSCKSLRLTNMVEKWRKCKKGHFAVYTREGRRFVLPLDYLKHPIFQVLLEMAEEEFGSTICGPLKVPCDGGLMDHILMLLRKKSLSSHGDDGDEDEMKKKNNHDVSSSMSMSCKGASSVSYFFPLFRCNAAHDQTKLQSLVF